MDSSHNSNAAVNANNASNASPPSDTVIRDNQSKPPSSLASSSSVMVAEEGAGSLISRSHSSSGSSYLRPGNSHLINVSGSGIKRASEPDSPLPRHEVGHNESQLGLQPTDELDDQTSNRGDANKHQTIDSLSCKGKSFDHLAVTTGGSAGDDDLIKEDEWRQSTGGFLEYPPYPISWVGRLLGMAKKFVSFLERYFIHRSSSISEIPSTSKNTISTNPVVTNPGQVYKDEDRFRRKNVPAISLYNYMVRICNYLSALDPAVLLTVLSYALELDPPPDELLLECGKEKDDNHCQNDTLDETAICEECHRLDNQTSRKDLRIDQFSVHRFLIGAIVLASKALGDHFYSNAYYAKVGGVSGRELNGLELDLAIRLDWRLQCSPQRMAILCEYLQ